MSRLVFPLPLSGKKLLAAFVASAAAGLGVLKGVSVEEIVAVITPLLAFIGAQGLADLGKEKAKIQAAAGVLPPPPVEVVNVANGMRPAAELSAKLDEAALVGMLKRNKPLLRAILAEPE